ncbi:hypothetical protein F511_26467 [Dorcoceras hygrometricum]|uniref:Uncharacterized protein n=1 Tax=Dorcoceras hygrometricum TaxID=472368 RepID=A0A2Z7DFZ9_9LAMI|nr:hypothetical protein F511_26467 [Dorcoceras hygrometricum]
MAPFAPSTRAAAAIRMKKIFIGNQSRTIRRHRAKLATERRESAVTKEGLENKLSSNMTGNRRSDSNNGGEGSSNSGAGLSREDLMAIATIVATTLQGLVNTNNSQAPPPIPPPHGTKYYYKSLRKNRAPLSMGTMTTKLPRLG